MSQETEPRFWAGLVHVDSVWDDENDWWIFVLSSDPRQSGSRAVRLELHQMIVEWCIDQMGPMSKRDDATGWYMSDWDAVSISDPSMATAFKLRWC